MKAKCTVNLSFAIEQYSKIHFVGGNLNVFCQIYNDFQDDIVSG